LSVLEEAVREAVCCALEDSFELSSSTVLLSAEGTHEANWLVQDVLLEELTQRGVHVRWAASDSVRQGDWVSPSGDSVLTVSSDSPVVALSYRIRYVGVEYIGHHRKRFLGEKWEDRLARAELALQLVDRSDGRVMAFQEVKGQVQDQFPQYLLEYVESSPYGFARSTLNTQSWTRFLEPVIVSAVVGGLIYLFYSSR